MMGLKRFCRRHLGAGVLIWLGTAHAGSNSAILNQIHAGDHPDKGIYRVTLSLTAQPQHQLRYLQEGTVIAVDLSNTRLSQDCRRGIVVAHLQSPVQEVQILSQGATSQRVLFKLRQPGVKPRKWTLPAPERLIFDFPRLTSATASLNLPGNLPAGTPGDSTETVLTRPAGPRQFKVIVIDPGHGGWDTGARDYGLQEKDIVLDVSKRLHAYFQKSEKFKSYLTRDGDYLPFVDAPEPDPNDYKKRQMLKQESLAGRVSFANQTFREGAEEFTADLFLSIHVNSFPPNRTVRGFEVWRPGEKLARDEMSRQLQAAENGEMLFDTVAMNGSTKDSAKTFISMVSEKIMEELNPLLAHHIEKQFRLLDSGFKSRGVKEGPFRVLRNLYMPSVLVEIGFITNRQEAESYLSKEWFRQHVAYALYTAINKYFEEVEGFQPELVAKPGKVAEPTVVVYRVRKGDSLYKIGEKFGVPYSKIKRYNQLNSDQLKPDQQLRIPL